MYGMTIARPGSRPRRPERRVKMTDNDEGRLVVLDEPSSGVWRATLNSPDDRNALSGAMRQAILDAGRTAVAAGAKVLVVQGDARAFSSGYKLDPGVMRPSTIVEDRARLVEVADFHRSFRQLPLVTIAQVRGYCLAGGTDFVLAHDVAVAADDASFGVPNVRAVGITLLFPLWSWVVGPQRAKLLALTGDTFTGAEAAEWGFVAAALPQEMLEERVLAVARRMAHMPTEMLAVTKQALNVPWDAAGFSDIIVRAAELDALAHATRPVVEWWDNVEANGTRAAIIDRDSPFRGGRIMDLLERK
jgi:enoyl-CoA hydratase